MIQSKTGPLKGFVRLSPSSNEVINKLGPLAGLVGNWNGNQGWNLIAVPSGPNGFQLLIENVSERITFSPVGAPVPNRGGTTEQFVVALLYELTVIDKSTQGVLHVENGMWLNLADVEKQNLGSDSAGTPMEFPIARQASVPHGDVVIALGKAVKSKGTPPISDINAVPDPGKGAPLGYTDVYFHNDFPQFNAANPNAMLRQALAGQTIGNVTTLEMDTANQGGSISNIPFLDQHVKPSDFKCTYWIEDVLNPDGSIAFQQLQYSQQTNLNFIKKIEDNGEEGLIMWPHVNVNTLVKE
jgi:hypothetical protein